MKHTISLTLILFLLTAPALAQTATPVYLPILLSGPVGNGVPQPSPIAPMPADQQLVMRREVIRLVNEYRVANDCPAAIEHEALMNGAQAWSDYMRANSFVQHSSMVDYDWYAKRGYTLASVAENIGAGQDSPQQILDDWKASKNHDRTLLSCRYSKDSSMFDIGIGLNGRLWTLALGEHLP